MIWKNMAPQKGVRSFAVAMGSGVRQDSQKRCELRVTMYVSCHTSINAVEVLSDLNCISRVDGFV